MNLDHCARSSRGGCFDKLGPSFRTHHVKSCNNVSVEIVSLDQQAELLLEQDGHAKNEVTLSIKVDERLLNSWPTF